MYQDIEASRIIFIWAFFVAEWKNLFEIVVKDQSSVILSCRTREEKNNWMYLLVMLTTKRYVCGLRH